VLALARVPAAIGDSAHTKGGIAQGPRDRIAFRDPTGALPSNLAHAFPPEASLAHGLTGAAASVEIAKAPPEGKRAGRSFDTHTT
jgi:hypothetical protein